MKPMQLVLSLFCLACVQQKLMLATKNVRQHSTKGAALCCLLYSLMLFVGLFYAIRYRTFRRLSYRVTRFTVLLQPLLQAE